MERSIMSRIIAYECGEMDQDEALDLLADLIQTGVVWSLQGSWQRAAASAVREGLITEGGERIA